MEERKEGEEPLLFETFEDKIFSVLSGAYAAVLLYYKQDIKDALASVDYRPNTLLDVVEQIGSESVVKEADRESIRKLSESAIVAGAAAVGFSMVLRGESRRAREIALADKTAEITRFYTNKYFSTVATPRIQQALQKAGNLNSEQAFIALQDKVESIISAKGHMRLSANQAASRATHYGMLKGAKGRGMRGYRLVAVLDDVTSDICRKLHGKEFWLDDGIAYYDKVLRAAPEDIKDVHPWVKDASSLDGLTSGELQSKGVMVPPFHASCRTGLVVIA